VDLVIFAGPVIVTAAHKAIDWRGRDVRILPINFEGSANGQALAASLRDSAGRILPNLLAKYAPGLKPDQIALASFSAGYGLLDPILAVPEDRALVTATCFADSVFLAGDPKTGIGGPVHPGAVAFGAEAVYGQKLLVSTSAHSTDGSYLNGMQSWTLTWEAIRKASGCMCEPDKVTPPAPVPPPPIGFYRLGSSCYWGDYGDALTHGQHNDLSAAIWQAYLSPWLAGDRGMLPVLLGAAAGAALGLAYLAHRFRANRRRR
jgi:hypothetical protein